MSVRTAISVCLLAAIALAWQATPTWPAIAVAADPIVSPSPDPSPTLPPDPTPTADPTLAPTPDPTAAPTPDSTATPDPSFTPDPSASPSGDPIPSGSPEPSPSASLTATPTIEYELSPGQQEGAQVPKPFPLWQLATQAADATGSTPHTGSATLLDARSCALCHTAHTAKQANLLTVGGTDSALCFTCHGSGSTYDIQAAFGHAPANDAGNGAIFAHSTPKCTDCHNPHDATNARPAQSTTGWTASGDIYAAAGVRADLSPVGRENQTGTSLTYEYELCFKCHSSAANLPVPAAAHPSWWALDAAAEFNPTSTSYHPIEAAGANQSAQMAASLAGTSPYKKWEFSIESIVRCTSCHADPSSLAAATSVADHAPSHATANRGLLIAPYRDRLLKPASELYQASDFQLCYLCHAERPFVDPNTNPQTDPDLATYTAFPLHGKHLTALTQSSGTGTSIDVAGAGPGLATCAECHFRLHSSAFGYQPGDTAPIERTGVGGLVNFAPDVVAAGATLPIWTEPGATGSGSCTLTCHGYTHDATNATYLAAPSAGFSAAATSLAAGASAEFIDETRYAEPAVDTWAWTFGDGATSTIREPTHAYAQAGSYSVSLTVTRIADGLTSTLTRTDYITVGR